MNHEGALRDELIAHLERTRVLRDPRIAAALRAVEPAPLRSDVYARRSVRR